MKSTYNIKKTIYHSAAKQDLVKLQNILIYSNLIAINFSKFEATKLGDFCYTWNIFESKLYTFLNTLSNGVKL